MVTCKLGEKSYAVDFVSGRALRELGPALDAHNKIVQAADSLRNGKMVEGLEGTNAADVYDAMIRWFCILFGGQFTPDEVYDNYPADRLIADVHFAMMAVMSGMANVLDAFPTVAAQETKAEKA